MASRVTATWPRTGNREALCFSNVRNIEPQLACGSLPEAQEPQQVRRFDDGWHLGCVAWFRMRNGFNNTNKTSARSCAGNSGRKFWRILEAFRRITGGMGTDSYLVRNLRTRDQPISGPIEAGEAARILLPSPSLQGYGLMCLRSGARPVGCPAALSSQPSGLRSQSDEHIVKGRIPEGDRTILCVEIRRRDAQKLICLASTASTNRRWTGGRGQRTSEPSLNKRTIWIPQN
jgi:hypothetical protein